MIVKLASYRRLLVTAFLAPMLLTLAGCPAPGPSPTPYSCGNVAIDHCYAQVTFFHTIETGYASIVGWRSRISIQPLFGGDGFVNDEFWLFGGANTCHCWVETGYLDDTSTQSWSPGFYYFWAEQDAPDGLFIAHELGDVPSADLHGLGTFSIAQTTPTTYAITVTTPTLSFAATSNNSFLSSPQSEGAATIGQELAGSSGAVADYVTFDENEEYSNGRWSYETLNGDPLIQGPPYGVWTPASQIGEGGLLWTECCTNPYPSTSPSAAPRPVPQQPVRPPPTVRPPTGIPALRVSRLGRVPSFTLAQAEDYAIVHTAGTTAVRSERVARAAFMTAAELSITLHGSATGLPSSSPVCFVMLNGAFSKETPPGPGHKRSVLHYRHAFTVLDARSGALLIYGYAP